MLCRILCCAVLLAPATAFAADDPIVDEPSDSICEQIGMDPYKCAQAYNLCHWDPADSRCEINPNPWGGGCGGIYNPSMCNATPGCQWDAFDPTGPRCESLGM
jgi:hypothetical protein